MCDGAFYENSYRLKLSILDAWQGSEYASGRYPGKVALVECKFGKYKDLLQTFFKDFVDILNF